MKILKQIAANDKLVQLIQLVLWEQSRVNDIFLINPLRDHHMDKYQKKIGG
jgi:predicted RNA-binding protein